jgi:flavin reductase (DIM6/NTAB) family NADH-FMN oxidoreductase RutF
MERQVDNLITIDPSSQTERENYKLLTGSIIPRPIAFVTSISSEGVVNAAPFSYFNIVAANPPLISISVQRKNQGIQKDTAKNIQTTEAFVVHISDEKNVHAINQSAANLPSDQSEVEYTGLITVASEKIKVPGIKEAAIRMECILERMITLGGKTGSPACDFIIGKVVCFHISDEVYENGDINSVVLQPVSRLGGNQYTKLGDIFTLERPE